MEATGLKHSPFKEETISDKMNFRLWSLPLPYGSPKSCTALWPTLEARYLEMDSENVNGSTGGIWL